MDAAYSFIPLLGEQVLDLWQEAIDQGLGDGRYPPPQNTQATPILPHALNEIRSIHDVRTLHDCLIFFSLPETLSELDDSLERVRKRQRSIKDHEGYSKEIDKKLQRKSFQHHPDRVSNRGGTPHELLEAEKAQTAINATRTVLSTLNEEFLGDVDIDHKYNFYAKLELNSLGNEEEIRRHIKHVLHKTVWLSEIKQVYIIAQIRMFLSESRLSLQGYIEGNLPHFKKHRDYAFYHLNKCIDGYDKLLTEYKIISEECRKESLRYIGSVIKEMESKSITESQTLKSLMDTAKLSLSGQFQVYSKWKNLDDYLILPFVCYVNVMLMCSLMQSKKHKNPFNILSYKSTFKGYIHLNGKNNLEMMLDHAAELAHELYNEYHSKPSNIYDEKKATEETIKLVFDNFMKNLKVELENRFKTEAYVEGGNRKFISTQYSNFMNIAKDIDEKVFNLFKDMENCKTVNEEIQKKYDHAVKLSCGFEKNIEESLKKSKLLHDEVSEIFMKSHPAVKNEEVSFVNASDDIERIIAESLEESEMLHEEVSKILNRRSQETVENDTNYGGIIHNLDIEVLKSINEKDLNHEQVFLDIKKVENETEFEKIYKSNKTLDTQWDVDNELVFSNFLEKSQTTNQSLVDRNASVNKVRYSVVLTENSLHKEDNINSTVGSTEFDIKTNECGDENNSRQCEFDTEHFISEKPKEIKTICSMEALESSDNEDLKHINVGDHLGNKSFSRDSLIKECKEIEGKSDECRDGNNSL